MPTAFSTLALSLGLYGRAGEDSDAVMLRNLVIRPVDSAHSGTLA
jgi:hypothetical protein